MKEKIGQMHSHIRTLKLKTKREPSKEVSQFDRNRKVRVICRPKQTEIDTSRTEDMLFSSKQLLRQITLVADKKINDPHLDMS